MRKKGIPEIVVSRELLGSYRHAVLELTCYAIKHGIPGFGRLWRDKVGDIQVKYPGLPYDYIISAFRFALELTRSYGFCAYMK